MRRKPVTRDEVRISARGQITTLPADAVHKGEPIEKLLRSLLQALRAEYDEHVAFCAGSGAAATAHQPRRECLQGGG